MHVALLSTATDFLRQTEQLRATDPFRTNLLGSVATSIASGDRTYERYFWWVIADENGEIVGAAMRTAPHGMVLSPMPIQAARELADAVAKHDDELPEIGGPARVVSAFIHAYQRTDSKGSSRLIDKSAHEFLYELKTLVMPTASGAVTVANQNDYELLMRWFTDFGVEAQIPMPNPSESIQAGLRQGSWHFWVVNDEIVSMAGHGPFVEVPSGTVVRIGPVYTPPLHRRKGYAGVLTATLSQELLDKGARVMLYTDATNPTSNGVYQRIGFELIDENERFQFT